MNNKMMQMDNVQVNIIDMWMLMMDVGLHIFFPDGTIISAPIDFSPITQHNKTFKAKNFKFEKRN